jgi:hypothetical protein
MAANIKGRNMRPIGEAHKVHTCEFIQAFDPSDFNQSRLCENALIACGDRLRCGNATERAGT